MWPGRGKGYGFLVRRKEAVSREVYRTGETVRARGPAVWGGKQGYCAENRL